MEAVPVIRPPRPSSSQLKFQICQAVQALTSTGDPEGWKTWDAVKVRSFTLAALGCHTGRSLPGLVASAREVIEAYGRDPREILPEGAEQ